MSYGGFVGKTEEREQLGDLELEGNMIFESYSKLIIEGRIHLFQDTCRWLALADTVMNSHGNFIDKLSDYQLTKHGYAPRNCFFSCLYLDRVLIGTVLKLIRNLNILCGPNARCLSEWYSGWWLWQRLPLLLWTQSVLRLSAGQAHVLRLSSYMSPGGQGRTFGTPSTQLKNLSQICESECRK